ncbi:MAG: hypothetical protein LBS62_00345 [Clostridiales bacterium]|nr:hypothetical protein [Clostridiales bacterium]
MKNKTQDVFIILCIFHKSTINLDSKFMEQEPVYGPAINMDFGVIQD